MADDDTTAFDPNEQRHHTNNDLVRVTRRDPFTDVDDERMLRALGEIAVQFNLPQNIPVPPAEFPGFWNRAVDAQAMGLIREGARYMLAAARGEKRTLWNIHESTRRAIRDAYKAGWDAREEQDADKFVADLRRRDFDAKLKERDALVYFIASEAGPIKIGKANKPALRVRELQTSHFAKLTVLVTCPGGLAQEQAYHRQFKAHRLHGEWFAPHPDILAEIERLTTSHSHTEGAA